MKRALIAAAFYVAASDHAFAQDQIVDLSCTIPGQSSLPIYVRINYTTQTLNGIKATFSQYSIEALSSIKNQKTGKIERWHLQLDRNTGQMQDVNMDALYSSAPPIYVCTKSASTQQF